MGKWLFDDNGSHEWADERVVRDIDSVIGAIRYPGLVDPVGWAFDGAARQIAIYIELAVIDVATGAPSDLRGVTHVTIPVSYAWPELFALLAEATDRLIEKGERHERLENLTTSAGPIYPPHARPGLSEYEPDYSHPVMPADPYAVKAS